MRTLSKMLGVAILVLTTACSDDDDPDPVFSQSCVLTEINGGTGGTEKYSYDGNGQLTQIESISNTGERTVTLLEYDGQRLSKASYDVPEGEQDYYVQLTYNSFVQATDKIVYAEGEDSERMRIKLEYDSNSKPSKLSVLLPTGLCCYFTYEYENGILSLARDYDGNGNLIATVEFDFDDKQTFIGESEALRALYIEAMPFEHNVVKETKRDVNGNIIEAESYNTVYEYNAAGYPIKFTATALTGNVITNSFKYSCK